MTGAPPTGATGPEFHLPVTSTFNPAMDLTIAGATTADTVAYAAMKPGCLLEQGVLPVRGGRFQFTWSASCRVEPRSSGSGSTWHAEVLCRREYCDENLTLQKLPLSHQVQRRAPEAPRGPPPLEAHLGIHRRIWVW